MNRKLIAVVASGLLLALTAAGSLAVYWILSVVEA